MVVDLPSGLCVVESIANCTSGFSLNFWVNMRSDCDGAILSTRGDNQTEGIEVACDHRGFFYDLYFGNDRAHVHKGQQYDAWLFVAFSGDNDMTTLVARHNGWDENSLQVNDGGGNFAPSPQRQLVLGRRFINTAGGAQGKARLDEVSFYNVELTRSEAAAKCEEINGRGNC